MNRIFYDANFRLKVEWGHRSVEEEDAMAAMELRHHSQGKRFISGHCIHRTISKKILRENLHENRNYFRISYIFAHFYWEISNGNEFWLLVFSSMSLEESGNLSSTRISDS